ncbi:hypothetical protein [Paenibacillus polymyxa]|uniref:hypothetical protein n=1 Tax=Paenibacillus polymyxa TaxID=1406 RepID=UPI002379BC87|nr:hypothetical protein [Paenibacillus polymyxa]WDM24551.1 hypothetical protein J4I02_18935 [Paenibacillus polymyxa]
MAKVKILNTENGKGLSSADMVAYVSKAERKNDHAIEISSERLLAGKVNWRREKSVSVVLRLGMADRSDRPACYAEYVL